MRYYYSDPLAAAWMAKYFEIKFPRDVAGKKNNGWPRVYSLKNILGHAYNRFASGPDKYYIHPDSLHLLEPQLWDVLRDNYWDSTPLAEDGVSLIEDDGDRERAKERLNAGTHYILERNGIAFMWPESQNQNEPREE